MKPRYICDFETANSISNEKDKTTNVWLAVAYDFDNDKTDSITYNINDFMNTFLFKHSGSKFYFHNLSFDGAFILSRLLSNGFNPQGKSAKAYTFETIIDDFNNFYMIKIRTSYNKSKKSFNNFTIYDSLKILPLSEKDLAERFQLSETKGSIDYTKERPIGYKATQEEIEYCINDVVIIARALKFFEDNKLLNGITIGSISFKEFAKTREHWREDFPIVDTNIDNFIRQAYRGGITIVNKVFKNKPIGEGVVYDANSLYPSQMKLKPMPYGTPFYFTGKPELKDTIFGAYIVRVVVDFEIKKNHIPSVQIKHNLSFNPRKFIEFTTEPTELYLTNIDLKLMEEQYQINSIKYIDGYYFKTYIGFFDEFITKWQKVKETSKGALRQIAKLILNNLYGKFVTNPIRASKTPYLNDKGILSFTLNEIEEIDPIYSAIGVFITSYGRYELIHYAQANYKRFLYADTDSVHLLGLEKPNEIPTHDTQFGYWKLESTFKKAKYLRAKTYLEVEEHNGVDINIVKCAGLPYEVRSHINLDNFKLGAVFNGKLARQIVKGGVILTNTTFTIKED